MALSVLAHAYPANRDRNVNTPSLCRASCARQGSAAAPL